MSDIFLSYSSKDRDRVRPFQEALEKLEFGVFWDLETPAGVDWEAWIKERLRETRCVIVFWSANATASRKVKYEVEVAERAAKLLEVRLEPLEIEQMRMGSFALQSVRLENWRGDPADAEWGKLRIAIESLATPAWIKRRFDDLQLTVAAERRRLREADAKVAMVEAALDNEIVAQGNLRRERDKLMHRNAELEHEIERVNHHVARIRQELETTSEKFIEAYRRHFEVGHVQG